MPGPREEGAEGWSGTIPGEVEDLVMCVLYIIIHNLYIYYIYIFYVYIYIFIIYINSYI